MGVVSTNLKLRNLLTILPIGWYRISYYVKSIIVPHDSLWQLLNKKPNSTQYLRETPNRPENESPSKKMLNPTCFPSWTKHLWSWLSVFMIRRARGTAYSNVSFCLLFHVQKVQSMGQRPGGIICFKDFRWATFFSFTFVILSCLPAVDFNSPCVTSPIGQNMPSSTNRWLRSSLETTTIKLHRSWLMKTWILDTDITCSANTYPLCPEIPDPYSPYIKHCSVHVYVWVAPQEFYSFLFKKDFAPKVDLVPTPPWQGRATWSPVDGTSRPGDCLPQLIAQGRTRPGELNAKYHLYMNWLTKEVQGVFHYHYPSRTKSSWIMFMQKETICISYSYYVYHVILHKACEFMPTKTMFWNKPYKIRSKDEFLRQSALLRHLQLHNGILCFFNLQIYKSYTISSHTNCEPITSMKYHEITSHFSRNSWTKSGHLKLWLSGFFIHRSPGDKKNGASKYIEILNDKKHAH